MSSRWRNTRHWIEYGAVRGALALGGLIPIGAGQRMGAVLGRIGFDGLRARRDVSVANIEAALNVGTPEATHIARAAYSNWGRSLMECFAFSHYSKQQVLDLIRFEGMEHIARLQAEGKGGMVIAPHLGNWELWGVGLGANGVPLHFLVGQQTNGRVDDVLNSLRSRHGVGIIKRAVALRRVLQLLGEGQFVATLPDQDARKNGVMVEFLGRPASTVRGPALFAIRRGCPIVPSYIRREGKRHVLTVEAPLYPRAMASEEDAVRDLTQRYSDRITAWVRAHPDEYFWAHRRWKTKASEPASSQPVA